MLNICDLQGGKVYLAAMIGDKSFPFEFIEEWNPTNPISYDNELYDKGYFRIYVMENNEKEMVFRVQDRITAPKSLRACQ